MRTLVALAWIAGCGAETGAIDAPLGDDSVVDIDAPMRDARIPTCAGVTFETSATINVLNTTDRETYLRLSPDELTAYFSRGNPEAPYIATRASITAPFSTPLPLAITGNGANEVASMTVTADGLTMYFTSDRTGTMGARDIWRATRAVTSTNFGSITAMTALNSTGTDNDVIVLPDHSAVYFGSNRSGMQRIYRAARNGSGFDPPVEVFADAATSVYRVAVSADELTLLYSEPNDIRLSTRASTSVAWLPGVATPAIDSTSTDFPSWISPDLCRLYYATNRTVANDFDLRIAVRSPQ
jgi:hypothetical protein